MDTEKQDRRRFMGDALRTGGIVAMAGAGGFLVGRRSEGEPMVWQLDPDMCTACGNCATHCVLDVSAVKCYNCFDMCGFCDVCTGYFEMNYKSLDTAAENQACPTGAIVRKFVEEKSGQRFYEYTIDEPICIGCAKCVEGCALMNGSLYLQIDHQKCLNCNECAIATACPTEAFYRIPQSQSEILKERAAAVYQARGLQTERLAQRDAQQAGTEIDPVKEAEANELLARAERQRAWRASQQAGSDSQEAWFE